MGHDYETSDKKDSAVSTTDGALDDYMRNEELKSNINQKANLSVLELSSFSIDIGLFIND